MINKYTDTLVLFDIGGVLVSLDFQSFYEKATSFSNSKQFTATEFKRRLIASRIDYLACKGFISEDAYLSKLRDIIQPSKKITNEVLKSIIQNAWKCQIDEMITLKQEIYEAGYRVGILSNITDLAFNQISKMYPLVFETYHEDSPKIYSFQVGSIKPEVTIYQNVKEYKNVIFIDDRDVYLKIPIEQFVMNQNLYVQSTKIIAVKRSGKILK